MSKIRRILAVITDPVLFRKVESLLGRSTFEVNRVPSGAGALILIGNLRYDLILVQSPLPDLALQDFVAAVRTLDSPCAGSAIVILNREGSEERLSEALLGDLVRVVPADAEESEIEKGISSVLGVSRRTSSRLLVHLRAEMDEGVSQRICQTVNLSETGMLLKGAPAAPIGSQVRVRFCLPKDSRAIEGEAEVVRYTSPAIEKVVGVAVRFVSLEAEDLFRLRDFVNASLSGDGRSGEPIGAEETPPAPPS